MEDTSQYNELVDFQIIKMEVDTDEEDIVDWRLEADEDDLLTSLKPIVYTTKLDAMNTFKQDLKELDTEEITRMVISESKPKPTLIINNSSNSENTQTYRKVDKIVHQINFKVRLRKHNTKVRNTKLFKQCKPLSIVLKDIYKHPVNKAVEAKTNISPNWQYCTSEVQVKFEVIDSIINSFTEPHSTCDSDSILSDRHTYSVSEMSDVEENVPLPANNTEDTVPSTDTLLNENDENVYTTEKTKTNKCRDKSPITVSSAKKIKTVEFICAESSSKERSKTTKISRAVPGSDEDKHAYRVSEVPDIEENVALPASNTEDIVPSTDKLLNENDKNILDSTKKTKTINCRDKSPIAVSSAKKIKTVETKCAESTSKRRNKTKKIVRTDDPDSDEDNTALVNLKKKPTTFLPTIQEKYALVVLLHNKTEAFVYRVNPTKLITDYYITTGCDEYDLAALYPREEKLIEHYCCWFKMEEVLNKICTRKNYSFTIQTFMRQPHSCQPGDCKCCCFSTNTLYKSQKLQKQRHETVKKSLEIAEGWVRLLLKYNPYNSSGLIEKALNYIPIKEKNVKPVIKKQPGKYLEHVLLCIYYTGEIYPVKDVAEIYVVGENGNVVRTFLLENREKCKYFQRTYLLMGLQKLEAKYCCWFTRENVMLDLRVANISPVALKLIQMPHVCERNKCRCCCKPRTITLKAIKTLPATLKHTTAYEKDPRLLVIRYNARSKQPYETNKLSYPKKIKKENNTDLSTASRILSGYASKEGNHDLSISILNKFRNLKLGVNSDGKIEVVLNGPAKNLSIVELKDLSDIIALCIKKVAELGLTPEEFCRRLKAEPGQSYVTLEIPQKSELIIAPSLPLPQKQKKDSTKPIKIIPRDTSLKQDISAAKTASVTSKSKVTMVNMCASISHLMEKKNKNYIDSFKSFFKGNVTSNVVPKMKRVPPEAKIPPKVLSQELTLPKIADTFTLVNTATEVPDIAIAGPSGINKRIGGNLRMEFSKNDCLETSFVISPTSNSPQQINRINPTTNANVNNTRTATKRTESFESSQIDKKIRVKSPSKLLDASDKQVAATSLPWPALEPIMIKREPHKNIQSIVSSSKPEAIQISPSLQTQAYLVGNQVVGAQNFQIVTTGTATVINNVLHMNRSHTSNYVTATNAQKSTSNGSVQYLTLTPITANNISIATDKTILAQILKTPQVELTPGGNRLPPLVPLKIDNIIPRPKPAVAPTRTMSGQTVTCKIEKPKQSTVDLEQSISFSVVTKKDN